MGSVSKESKKIQREVAARLLLLREVFHDNNASEAGRAVKLTPQAWYNYETGRRQLDLNIAKQVCEAHGVDYNWLYSGSERGLKKSVREKLALATTKKAGATLAKVEKRKRHSTKRALPD